MSSRAPVARLGAHLRRCSSAALAAVVVSLTFVVPAALFGPASPAAAALSAPDRPSVPALVPSSQSRALPSDSTDVRIAMTENNGLDVIVAGSGGSVSAPGVPGAAAVRFQQTDGTWAVETGAGCSGPWGAPVLTNQTTPTASPVGGLLTLCVAGGSPTVHGTLTRALQLGGPGEDGEHAAARAVRGGHRARGVAVELGRPGWLRSPGHGLGLPGARGPGRGRPLVRPGRPGRLRRLRRHLRPDLPDLPRHRVRDGDHRGGGQRHRRPGDADARRPDRHHRVLRLDGGLHLELQPGVAVQRRARRWRRGVRRGRLQHQPPMDRLGQRRDHPVHLAPDRHASPA